MPTLPMTDIKKSRDFYEGKLGLKPSTMKVDQDGLLYEVGQTFLYLYQRPPSKAEHTLASFSIDDIEKTVDELGQKGVVFEHYDMPGLKTDAKGIVTMEKAKAAWFKDPDGNILGLLQT